MPRTESNSKVQSLWIGPRLSTMERLCIASFVHHGHAFHLYAYDEVQNLPDGVTILDANEILPRSSIFTYRDNGSVAGFANHFRYKLLMDRGGWWVDLDMVCLRPFDLDCECVVASEPDRGGDVPTNAIIKAQAGSALMEYALRVCESKDPAMLVWGETGPRLIGEAVERLGLGDAVASATTFCPVSYREWDSVLLPGATVTLDASWSVHLWNEMWRREGRDKDASYPPDCLYERLKSRYLAP